MLFLIAMIVACVFSWFCAKPLKAHPTPFYITAAVVSVIMIMIGQVRPEGIPQVVNTYVIGLFNRGALAAALWCVVAYIGAVPDGAKAIKKQLMPSRGELSIFAAVVTLSHAVTYGITYIKRLTSGRPVTETVFILTCIICLVLMLIMIPLTVISFKTIRKKIKPKTWKAIQRVAYVFYALIYLHVMVIFIPRARIGREGAMFDVIVYSIVFLGYAALRIRKAIITTKKPENHSILNIVCTAVFVLTIGGLGLSSRSVKPMETADASSPISTTAPTSQTVTTTTNAISTTAETSVNSVTPTDSIIATEAETLLSTESADETAPLAETTAPISAETQVAVAVTTASPTVTSPTVTPSGNENAETQAPANDSQTEEQPVQNEQQPAEEQTAEPVQNDPAPAQNDPAPVQNDPAPAQNDPAPVQNDPEPAQNTPEPEPIQNEPEPQPEPEPPASVLYNDGTYSSTQMGFDSQVSITVTIQNDVITDLTASCNESDMWFFENAYGTIKNAILASQSPDVDSVSESTISSEAIKNGVRDCLNQAKK